MNRRTYKIAFLLSISVLVLLFKTDNSKGCGWYPEPDSYYNIFVPELFKLPNLKPFFLSEQYFYPVSDTSSLDGKYANLKAWKEYFENVPSIADIEKVIYKTTEKDIGNIKYLKAGIYLSSIR